MRVKICGITNIEDGIKAVELGADGLGFVFYPPSPRFITPKSAKEIIAHLPPFVSKVALFVKVTVDEVVKVCHQIGADTAQLHWEVSEGFLEKVAQKGIYPLPVVRARHYSDLKLFKGRYRLVDSFVKGYGGAGKRLQLEWFKGKDNSKIVLAGGLNPDNLAELKGFGFYGVDVSSGVEASPGRKDWKKMERFISIAHNL